MKRTPLSAVFALLFLLSSATVAAQASDDDALPPAPPPPPPDSAPAASAPAPASATGASAAPQPEPASAPSPAPTAPPPAPPPPPSFPKTTGEAEITPPPDPGKEAHDGFMLRLTIGFGTAGVKEKLNSSASSTTGFGDATLSGVSGSFSLDIGGSIAENLVLHGRIAEVVIVDPKVRIAGTTQGTATNTSVAALLLGPALTYYVMPLNLYFTGAVGLSALRVQDSNGNGASTGDGIGLQLDVGKEWWVSDQWGFGGALRFAYTHVTTKNGSLKATDDFLGWALLFSVTYQ